jgi:hypothetical protein
MERLIRLKQGVIKSTTVFNATLMYTHYQKVSIGTINLLIHPTTLKLTNSTSKHTARCRKTNSSKLTYENREKLPKTDKN